MPRFDSDPLFASLLDPKNGGEFSVRPADPENWSSRQYYLENTNILCTEFKSREGAFRVVDFAPRYSQVDRYFRPLMLVRKIEPLSGRPTIRVRCEPVADFNQLPPQLTAGSNHIRFMHLADPVRLTTDIPLTYILNQRSFVLDGPRYLCFTYGIPLEAGLTETMETFLRNTTLYWRRWIKTTSIPSLFQEEVIRSALVLKLHQFEDTGGIIAAGSMGLPESPRPGRNWDYRYCWIRDAYYILNAFNHLGHFEELERYFQFILNILASQSKDLNPLYTIGGDTVAGERQVPLAGYRNYGPVVVGNNANLQIQHDVFGQILISLLPLFADRRLRMDGIPSRLDLIDSLLGGIERTLLLPDAGIWEYRNRMQRHCYTALFHWAGTRAAVKIAGAAGAPRLREKAERLSLAARNVIEACFCPDKQAYAQAVGVTEMDASTLQLITMNYLDPNSDRARAHLHAVEKDLLHGTALMYRYHHPDDFGSPETAFLTCSFWYAESLACVGEVDRARTVFEALLKLSNPLGLYSEDAADDGSQWGNMPQAYCHVGLINAAYRIANRLDRPLFL